MILDFIKRLFKKKPPRRGRVEVWEKYDKGELPDQTPGQINTKSKAKPKIKINKVYSSAEDKWYSEEEWRKKGESKND